MRKDDQCGDGRCGIGWEGKDLNVLLQLGSDIDGDGLDGLKFFTMLMDEICADGCDSEQKEEAQNDNRTDRKAFGGRWGHERYSLSR